MLQLTPQTRVFLACEPADFRRGIDGLAALCRQRLGADPMDGAIFVFRNYSATMGRGSGCAKSACHRDA